MQQWLILAVVMGLMLSPESLVILGNSAGVIGTNTAVSLALALLTVLFTWGSYRALATQFREPYDESTALQTAFGPWLAIILPICARVIVAVCAATLSLATAGYASQGTTHVALANHKSGEHMWLAFITPDGTH